MRTPFFSLFSSNIWKSPLTAFLLYPRVSRLLDDHIPSCPSSSRLLSLSCHYVSAYIIKNKNKKHLNGSLFLHVSLFNIFSIKKKKYGEMRERHLDTSGCMGPFLKAPRPPHWGWAPRRHVICPSPLLPGPPSPPTFTALGSYCFLHSLGTSHLSLWYFLLCLKKFTRLDLSRPSGLC